MTCQPGVRYSLSIRAGPSEALRIGLRASDDIDANRKATMIVTRMNTRDDSFVELTRAGGVTVPAADRPYRKAML